MLTEDQLRAESWYPRYLQSVLDHYATARRNYPDARIKFIGVIPDNHPEYGVRTRIEFNCLEQDMLRAMRQGTVTMDEEPEMHRVAFKYLKREIDDANKDEVHNVHVHLLIHTNLMLVLG